MNEQRRMRIMMAKYGRYLSILLGLYLSFFLATALIVPISSPIIAEGMTRIGKRKNQLKLPTQSSPLHGDRNT